MEPEIHIVKTKLQQPIHPELRRRIEAADAKLTPAQRAIHEAHARAFDNAVLYGAKGKP